MKISKKQDAIIHARESRVVVIASAAAGKTTVLTERVKYLLEQGVNPLKIVVITFTNAAAESLYERVGQVQGLFIGTIHSYANYLLRSAGIDTSDMLDQEQFDLLFPTIKANLHCIKEVEHLLLDESQDSTEVQLDFMLDMVKPKNYMLVGDFRQSIYRFAGAEPDYLLNLSKDPTVQTYDLNENYRNGRRILEYAKYLIGLAGYDYYDHSLAMRPIDGKVVEVEYSPTAIARTIKKMGNYHDWFVLTRTNDQCDEMMRELGREDVPCSTFKRSQLTNKELYHLMDEDKVKVMTIHTSKGLEAPNVVVIGAKFYNIEEKCVSYVAATRARDLLVWARTQPRNRRTVSSWE